jgi:hypothetical protein
VSNLRILKDEATVSARIRKYNSQPKGADYDRAYHAVLKARRGKRCLVDDTGSISEESLQAVKSTLRVFDMDKYMAGNFTAGLKEKLHLDEIKNTLKKFSDTRVYSLPQTDEVIAQFKAGVRKLYEVLSVEGEDSLDRRSYRFDVGTTKIMNFLFPELFVIADRHVRKAVHKSGELHFEKYWDIMMICQGELQEWREQHHDFHSFLRLCDFHSLLRLDSGPTTVTRIFDKCAFVMGKNGES